MRRRARRPDPKTYERDVCDVFGMRHDGRPGAADCIGANGARLEVKSGARPMTSSQVVRELGRKAMQGGGEQILATRRGYSQPALATALGRWATACVESGKAPGGLPRFACFRLTPFGRLDWFRR